jgi:hypothetical protein
MESLHTNYIKVIEAGKPFEDMQFPAGITALFDPEDRSEGANLALYTEIEFKRAAEIFGDEFCIFPENK